MMFFYETECRKTRIDYETLSYYWYETSYLYPIKEDIGIKNHNTVEHPFSAIIAVRGNVFESYNIVKFRSIEKR